MSHFTVLIIGDNPEEQLKPYQENNMDDCPKEYLEFVDVEEEYRNEYENGTFTKVIMPDGRMLDIWDEQFRVEGIGIIPDNLEQRKVPMKELYSSFEQFIKDYAGYRKDPETGKYGYWENPNAKWDWYQLGGRWTGFFKLKENISQVGYEVGTPGIMTEEAKSGYVDQTHKRNIDFEAMKKEAEEKAIEGYDKFENAIKGIEIPEPWDSFREKYSSIEEARKAWHSLPFSKALKDADIYFWGQSIHDYFFINKGGREKFIENKIKKFFTTFAVIKDGKWYERGSMGWWGIVIDEKDEWDEQFYQLLEDVSDDTLLTVVDCHI